MKMVGEAVRYEIYENTRVKIHGKFNNNTEKELSMKRSS